MRETSRVFGTGKHIGSRTTCLERHCNAIMRRSRLENVGRLCPQRSETNLRYISDLVPVWEEAVV